MINEHAFPEKRVLLFGLGAWRGEAAPDQGDSAGVSADRAGFSGGGEKAQKGDFGMEYMCEFMEDGNSVFNRDLVMKALDPTVEPFDFSGIGTWR